MIEHRFELVTNQPRQIKLLFELLNSRKFHISNRGVTEFNDHKKFVEANFYRCWYIIFLYKKPLGSFYLHNNNCIGINVQKPNTELIIRIIDYIKSKYKPLREIKSTIPPFFYVNVSIKDKNLSKILKEIPLYKIQETYEIK